MANTAYTDMKRFKIFVIIHEDSKQFFVHRSTAQRLDKMFSSHYSLKNSCTKKMFWKYRETLYPPQMYLLEEFDCTQAEADVRIFLWIKYFQEHGYTCLNYPGAIACANDLREENLQAYKAIENVPYESIINEKSHQCKNYGRHRIEKTQEEKDANEKKQVKFFCTNEEYELIKAQARRNDLTVSAYLRQVAIYGKVLDLGFEPTGQLIKEYHKVKGILNAMARLFINTKQIYSSDIDELFRLISDLTDSQRQYLQDAQAHRDRVRRNTFKDLKKFLLK